MGWAFAAVWVEDPDGWRWVWRRVADDSGALLGQSTHFDSLDACVRDARENGFDETDCGPV